MARKYVATIIALWAGCAAAYGYTIEQYLNIRGNFQGYWLPGGEEIIFRNKATGVTQAWRMAAEGGWPEQITFFDEGVFFAVPHRVTGNVLAATDVGGNERYQLCVMNADGSSLAPLTDNPEVIYDYGDWSRDGRRLAVAANERDERYFDIYVYDLETAERRLVMQHDGYNRALAFSPDGSSLITYRARGSQDADLYLIDLTTGETRHLTPHEGELEIGAVAWAADGSGFYYTHDEGRDFLSLGYYDLASGRREWLETPPWDVTQLETSWSGRYLLWTTNEDGYSVLHLRDLKKDKDVAPPKLPAAGVMWGIRFSPDETKVLFTFSSPTTPTDVYVWRIGEAEATPVTKAVLAGIPAESFAAPELIFYPSFDGTMIPAYQYVPRGAEGGGRIPVVVHAHGGPQVQQRPYFDAVYQYFLDAGYAVFVPNFRGSMGYGKAYADADNLEHRLDAVVDVFEGWRYLAEQPWCDRLKVAVYGSSYGGFIVLSELTQKPYHWAAGIDIVGIANFVTFLRNTGPWRVSLREDEYGSLERDRELLEAISPINHIQDIRSPLMVIHGANDPRVPVSEAEQIVEAARMVLGDDKVVYLRYEDEGHGLRKRANRLDAYPKMVRFLEEAFAAREAFRERLEKEVEEAERAREEIMESEAGE
ncbi:MAG: prolyl oligopeptidase family serine peptidase [candidate division Zixibacteria bacterium]|nr:prolyl oligopeptidase family serine peptidase [candidate division Zixibacteria bacterium]